MGWEERVFATWTDADHNWHTILRDDRVGMDHYTYWSSGPFPLKRHLLSTADVAFGVWPEQVCKRIRFPAHVSDDAFFMLRGDERRFNEAMLMLRGAKVKEQLRCEWKDEVLAARKAGMSVTEELGVCNAWDGPNPHEPLPADWGFDKMKI